MIEQVIMNTPRLHTLTERELCVLRAMDTCRAQKAQRRRLSRDSLISLRADS